jgi:site-specific recombinase XerC
MAEMRRRGRSAQTANHYVQALQQFLNWIAAEGRVESNPIRGLRRANVDVDRRRRRRALSNVEMNLLIEAARRGPKIEGVSGPDRAILYEIAASTGLRRSELASLTRHSFDLTSAVPTINVTAAYTKNRRDDAIPLHAALVVNLAGWLDTKRHVADDEPLLPVAKRKTGRMMQRDLAAAGVAYVDENGHVADFHALRHTFITNLVQVGRSGQGDQQDGRHAQRAGRHHHAPARSRRCRHWVALGQRAACRPGPALVPNLVP